jgi:broad specificity phosphatase PhoE
MQCLIVQVVFDPALRERHIGDLQGMKFQDAATERPEAYKAFMSHKRNQQIPVSFCYSLWTSIMLSNVARAKSCCTCMSNVEDLLKHR